MVSFVYGRKAVVTTPISTVNWMRYTVLKPGQSRARLEDPSAILNAGTWSHLGGKFKRS